jgi:WD40 repeat protein
MPQRRRWHIPRIKEEAVTLLRNATWLWVGLMVLGGPAGSQQPKEGKPAGQPGLDADGDPLPAGAVARLGTARLRHAGRITDLRFTPDGKALLSASNDGSVRLWDAATGRELRRWLGDNAGCFSPDGKLLATWGKTAHVWDVATGQELPWSPAKDKEKDLFWDVEAQFSHDGSYLALVGQLRSGQPSDAAPAVVYQVWQVATGKRLLRVVEPQKQYCGRMTWFLRPDGTLLVPDASDPGVVRDVGSGKVRFEFRPPGQEQPKKEVYFPQKFLGNGKDVLVWVGVGDAYPGLAVVDVATGKERFRILPTRWLNPPQVSPDGRFLVVGTEDKEDVVSIWDLANGKRVHRIPCAERFWSLQFSPDSGRVAIVDRSGQTQVWDVTTGKKLREVLQREADKTNMMDNVPCLAFSPDGKILAIGGAVTPFIELWDLGSGQRLGAKTGHAHPAETLQYAPNGQALVSRQGLFTLQWQAAAGKLQARHRAQWPSDIFCTLWSPGGRLQVIAGPSEEVDTAHLRDLALDKVVRSLDKAEQYYANSAGGSIVSADGRSLAACLGQYVALWHLATGKRAWMVPWPDPSDLEAWKHAVLAFSPDGKVLAARGQRIVQPQHPFYSAPAKHLGWVVLWEVASGKERKRLEWEMPKEPNTGFYAQQVKLPWSGALLLAPDGKTVVLGDGDTLRQVSLSTGKEIRRFGGFGVHSAVASLSPNGKLLAALTESGSVQLWDVATGNVLEPIQPPPPATVTCFAFSPDGRHLATGCSDTTILVWAIHQGG